MSFRIDPIAKDIDVMINRMLAPAEKKRVIAEFARTQLRDAQQTNRNVLGRVPPHETFVDGRRGAALESVDPRGGKIVFEFELVADVLRWIGKTLEERSPVVSGEYKRGHTVFADGVEIALGGQVPLSNEYTFTNYVLYARKIEIGKTRSGRDFVIQVPNQIYERTARDARRRFGKIAEIEFTFRGIVSGKQYGPHTVGLGFRSRLKSNKSKVRYPTIIVTGK